LLAGAPRRGREEDITKTVERGARERGIGLLPTPFPRGSTGG